MELSVTVSQFSTQLSRTRTFSINLIRFELPCTSPNQVSIICKQPCILLRILHAQGKVQIGNNQIRSPGYFAHVKTFEI